MRACLALTCLFSTLVLAAPVPKEIKKKPSSLAGTWKILETQRFGAQPTSSERYWTLDAKGNSWFHSAEKPPDNSPPSDVNVADFATGEMNHRNPSAQVEGYTMHGVFAFEGDVLVINYDMDKTGRAKRPKSIALEPGGMQWRLKQVAE